MKEKKINETANEILEKLCGPKKNYCEKIKKPKVFNFPEDMMIDKAKMITVILLSEGKTPTEINKELNNKKEWCLLGNLILGPSTVKKWCRKLFDGNNNPHALFSDKR